MCACILWKRRCSIRTNEIIQKKINKHSKQSHHIDELENRICSWLFMSILFFFFRAKTFTQGENDKRTLWNCPTGNPPSQSHTINKKCMHDTFFSQLGVLVSSIYEVSWRPSESNPLSSIWPKNWCCAVMNKNHTFNIDCLPLSMMIWDAFARARY